MNSLMRRIEAIERRNSTAVSIIPGSEVSSIKAALRRKLGLPAPTGDCAPISYKAAAKAAETLAQKLRSFLETRAINP